MNMEIDIPTAVIVSAVWILLGLALLARRYTPARQKPVASRAKKPAKKIERQSVPSAAPDA